MSTDTQNYGELLTRRVSTSNVNAALNGSNAAGNKRDLTLTCSKDDNSSQLSLILHHDDDGNGVDVNTATFSADTQIKGVLNPTDGNDVATKTYTDNTVGEVGVVTDTNRDQIIDTLELKHLIDPSGLAPQPGVGTSLKYISSISDQAEHEIGTVAFETLDDNPVVPGGTTTDADLNTNFNISNYKEGTKNLSLQSAYNGSLQIFGTQYHKFFGSHPYDDANDLTYDATYLSRGFIFRDCNGASRTDTLPDGPAIANAFPLAVDKTTFHFSIINISSGSDEDLFITVPVSTLADPANTIINSPSLENICIKPGSVGNFMGVFSGDRASVILQNTGSIGIYPLNTTTWLNDSNNNGISYPVTLRHTTTGTPGTGIGVGLDFITETAADNQERGMTINSVSTNIGGGAEAFDFIVNLMAGGAVASEVMRSSSDGYLKIANSQLYKNTSDIVDTVSNTIVVNADAVNTTYTAAEVLSGFIVRNATATTMDMLPTSESIIAAIPNCQIGDTFEFAIQNISTGGPGIDIMLQSNFDFSPPNSLCFANGNITIKQGEIRKFWAIVISNVATFRIAVYGLGIRDSISNGFFDVADTATNTVTNIIDLTHKLKSGSVAANGIGAGINFKSVLTDGSMSSLGSIEFVTMDATNTALLSSKIRLNAVNSGTEQQVFEVNNSGDIELGDANTPTNIYSRGTNIIFNSPVITNEGLSANQVGSSATYNVSPFTIRGQTTSSAPSAGSSTSIPCYMEVRAGVNEYLSRLKTVCTDNVVDEEKGDFIIELLNNTGVAGNVEEKFRVYSDGNAHIRGPSLYKKQTTPNPITTAGPVTYTAEMILSGLIIRDCSGSSRTDILINGSGPTGLIKTMIDNKIDIEVGTTFYLTIANTSGTGEDITLQDVPNFADIVGVTTIKAGESISAQIVIENDTEVAGRYTMYTLSSSSGGGGGSNGIFTVTDTVLNSVSIPVTLKHLISSGTILTGIGTGMDFVTQTTAGDKTGMSLNSVTTNVGAGTEAFDFVLNLMAGGATASEALRVTSDKVLTIPSGGDIFLPDNAELRFGDSTTPDVTVKFDATDLLTTMVEGSNVIKLENSNTGFVVKDPSDNIVSQTLGSGTTLFRKTTNSDNAVEEIVRIQSLLNTPGNADVGYGAGLAFDVNDLLGNLVNTAIIKTVATSTTDGSENYDFFIQNMAAGSLVDALRIDSGGTLYTNCCKIVQNGVETAIVGTGGGDLKLSCLSGESDSFSPTVYLENSTSGSTYISAGTATSTKIQLSAGDYTDIVKRDNTTTYNTITDVARLTKLFLQSGLPAVGCGVGLNFACELLNAGGTAGTSTGREIGNISVQTEDDAQDGSYNSKILFYNYSGGAKQEALSITKDKVLTMPTGGNMFLPDSAEIKIGNTAVAPHSYIKHDSSDFIIGNNSGDTGNIIIRTESTESTKRDVHVRLSNINGSSNFLVKGSTNANVFNVPSDGASICIKRDTSNINKTTPLTLYHNIISPTIAQAGIGTELAFNSDLTDETLGHAIGSISFRTLEDDAPAQAGDTTNAKLKSRLLLKNFNAGSEQTVLEIDNTGKFTVGNSAVPCTIKSQTTDLILASASDKQCKIRDADGSVQIDGPQIYKRSTVSDITTAGDETYTGAQILNGLITRDCAGASRNDSVPTYANLTSALGFSNIGSTFELIICNISDVHNEDLFIKSNGTGLVVGINRIPKGTNMKFTGVITTGTVYTLFSHGQKEYQTVNIESSDPYVRTINGTNHTWTPEELFYGTVRRTTGGTNSEDILPNPNLILTSFPQLKAGDKISLSIINMDGGNISFNASANGDLVCRGTTALTNPNSFNTAARQNCVASANRISSFDLIIYEVGVSSKGEMMIRSRR